MRAVNPNGRCKYALVRLDKIPGTHIPSDAEIAAAIMANPGIVEHSIPGSKDEFLAIKLKDAFSYSAIAAYAEAAKPIDAQYASDIFEVAMRAGPNHPLCHIPD